MTASKLVLNAASGAGGDTTDIDDLFRTYLYTGDSSSGNEITGIDTLNEGGLVWLKHRSGSNAFGHAFYDTVRGNTKQLRGDLNSAESTESRFTGFLSNGFSLSGDTELDYSGDKYIAWTFRKAEKFFDIVTWTGNESNRDISHNLGSEPGMILIKRRSAASNWIVYHRFMNGGTNAGQYYLKLNENSAQAQDGSVFDNTSATSTTFRVGTHTGVNKSGETYVAYLFADNTNDGEFGPDSDQNVIKCFSFAGNESLNLGFEPQWIMAKRYDNTGAWWMLDANRGLHVGQNQSYVVANTSGAEGLVDALDVNSTGFLSKFGGSGANFIGVAIRRGPLNVPDDASKVFHVDEYASNSNSNTYTTGFDVDMNINTRTANSTIYLMSRLTNDYYTPPNNSGAASNPTGTSNVFTQKSNVIDLHTGWWGTTNDVVSWSWKRAPGYFDEVNYDGNATPRTITHNLNAVPEMMWVKRTSTTEDWTVYHTVGGVNKYYQINSTGTGGNSSTAGGGAANIWNGTTPTASVFSIGDHDRVNTNGQTYSAWLFATAPGVSKVGYYTGSSGTIDVDCGFSNGAKFILIKLVSHSGHGWYIFDSQRGIVSGDDPYKLLNESNSAEVTTTDAIDPLSSGFQVTVPANAGTGVNYQGYVYLFYAVAA